MWLEVRMILSLRGVRDVSGIFFRVEKEIIKWFRIKIGRSLGRARFNFLVDLGEGVFLEEICIGFS